MSNNEVKEKSNKVIILSEKMINKLNMINHFISKHLINLHEKKEGLDVKFSYIDIANQEGMVSYLSSSKEFDQTGKEIIEQDKWVIKARTNVRVGAVVRYILLAKNINFKDSDIEDFSNKFRTSSDEKFRFELVKGEDIKKWYYQKNYTKVNKENSLLNSCMRHKVCSTYFTVYTNNENVSMLVCIDNKTNLLLARGIVWHNMYISGVNRVYVDRIYCYDDRFLTTVKDYIFSQGWWCKVKQSNDSNSISDGKTTLSSPTMKVSIPMLDWDLYKKPYMDTMKYMKEDVAKGKLTLYLTNQNYGKNKESWTSTSGGHGINYGYASIFDRYVILSKNFKVSFDDISYSKDIFTIKGNNYTLTKSNVCVSNIVKNNLDCLIGIDFVKFINISSFVSNNLKLITEKYAKKINKYIEEKISISKLSITIFSKILYKWLEDKNNFDYTVKNINIELKKIKDRDRDRHISNNGYNYWYSDTYNKYPDLVIKGKTKESNIKELIKYIKKYEFAYDIVLNKMDIDISKKEVIKNISPFLIKLYTNEIICNIIFKYNNLSKLEELFDTKDRVNIFGKVKKYIDVRYIDWNDLDSKSLSKVLVILGYKVIPYKKGAIVDNYILKEVSNKVSKKVNKVKVNKLKLK